MSILNTGAPHFKSVMKQHRHANYTLPKVLNEFVDNIIKKTDEIRIYTQIDDEKNLQEFKVSDNYIHGFDNLDCEGVNNPFNMGHIKSAHEDDSETSEFGVGMKAGALSAANQLNVYTRVKNLDGTYKYIEVICDFIRMSNEPDVNASYNPRIRIITYDEYKEHHPFDQGSTLKLSKIRDCIYSKTTVEEITEDISNCMANTYVRFISKGTKLYVNDSIVSPTYDFFDDVKCEPFTINKDLFILEKSGIVLYLIRKTKEIPVWQEFNRDNSRWTKLKEHNDGLKYIQELKKIGYKMIYTPFTEDGVCMQINTTFTFYSDKYHTNNHKSEPDLPEDCVNIYKDDRNYGKQSLLKHNNGVHNYTLHEIDFVSKRLGKDLGITFNKEILMNGNNDLIIAIKAALVDSREEFTADTSVKKNADLCEKAIKNGLIDLMTCPEAKLSATHRSRRIEMGEPLPSIVSIKQSKKDVKSKPEVKPNPEVKPKPEVVDSDDDISELSDSDTHFNETFVNEEFVETTNSTTDLESDINVNINHNDNNNDNNNDNYNDENINEINHVDSVTTDIEDNNNIEEDLNKEKEYNDRKRRTVIIMDQLHKSISGSNDDVLTEDILKILESIFT